MMNSTRIAVRFLSSRFPKQARHLLWVRPPEGPSRPFFFSLLLTRKTVNMQDILETPSYWNSEASVEK